MKLLKHWSKNCQVFLKCWNHHKSEVLLSLEEHNNFPRDKQAKKVLRESIFSIISTSICIIPKTDLPENVPVVKVSYQGFLSHLSFQSCPPATQKKGRTHIYNGILLSHKKEWNWVICNEVDEPRVCHTEWSNSEREKQIPYANTYIWNLKQMVLMNLVAGQE